MTAAAVGDQDAAPPHCRAPEGCNTRALFCRVLPDGRVIHLVPMLFNVRVCIESPIDNEVGCYTDGWCFDRDRLADAFVAAATWDGAGDPPGNWKKHVTTGRPGPGAFRAADDEEGAA